MLHAYGKPHHDSGDNKLSYKALLHHLRRFGCHVTKLIPEPQRKGKFGVKSRLGCMMVGYVHGSTTTWRVWDPEHQTVRTQSDVIFNEARNVYASLPGDPEATTDSLCLVKELVHVEVLEAQEVGRTAAVQEVGRTAAALREVGRTAAVQEVGRTAAALR